jgi:hypothetical protein
LFKGYQLYTGITADEIVVSHMLTPPNRHDAAVTPEVFSALKDWNIRFALGDAAYDSKKVQTIARREHRSVFGSPRNQKNEYDSRVVEGDIWKTVMGLAYQH